MGSKFRGVRQAPKPKAEVVVPETAPIGGVYEPCACQLFKPDSYEGFISVKKNKKDVAK